MAGSVPQGTKDAEGSVCAAWEFGRLKANLCAKHSWRGPGDGERFHIVTRRKTRLVGGMTLGVPREGRGLDCGR